MRLYRGALPGGQQVDLIEQDDICLGELTLVEVGHGLGQPRKHAEARGVTEPPPIHHHAEWPQTKRHGADLAQRLVDRGRKIRTGADRLGQDHVGPLCVDEVLKSALERLETTTETAVRYLADAVRGASGQRR